jgi:hypothetical protein
LTVWSIVRRRHDQFLRTGIAIDIEWDGDGSRSRELGQPELWCALSVETSGCGYLTDWRPKILFERHIFSRLTGHQFDGDDADISQPTSGGYGPFGAHQYDRLSAAMQLNASAALQSASWGLGQIIGENYHDAGYASVESMVSDMVTSEDSHVRAMVNFAGRYLQVRYSSAPTI